MMDRKQDTSDIFHLLDTYFEALYDADAEQLGTIFHEDGLYVSTTDGEYLNRSIPVYLDVVAQREAPRVRNEVRNETVHAIEYGGPNLAFVRLDMHMMNRCYTDFLTLYKGDKGWKIMAKVFSFNPQGN
jgi:hypothetical protein